MLSIIPDYDESDDSSDYSGSETLQSDGKARVRSKRDKNITGEPLRKEKQTSDVTGAGCSINDGGGQGSKSIQSSVDDHQETATNPAISHTSEMAEDVSSDIGMASSDLASNSGLSSEQKSTLRYLTLKRRKDEELQDLEEAERREGRREACKRRRQCRRRKGQGTTEAASEGTIGKEDPSDDMKKLSSYMGVNDHLRGALVDHGDLGPKCGLEKQIDEAVAEGDVDRAEQLSNYLASRNFGVRVAEAAGARDYTNRKQEEEESRLAKKRQKKARLAWGFEVKHRWEMKGNM